MSTPDRPPVSFIDRMAERDAEAKAAKRLPAVNGGAPAWPTSMGGDQARRQKYADRAMADEVDSVATAPPGRRNDVLNAAAFSLARFVNDGLLEAGIVENALRNAAAVAGLPDAEVDLCLGGDRHQRDAAAKRPGDSVPPPSPTATMTGTDEVVASRAVAVNGHEPLTPDEAEDLRRLAHDGKVAQRAYDMQVNDEARELWASRRAAATGQCAPVPINLVDFLAVPDEDAAYRIQELLPTGGRALLAAQYKAGKTTLVANLLRSLVDGDPFLGAYRTDPVGRIVLMDTELDERMLRRWLRTQNIRNRAAIDVLSLRGKLSTFNIVDDAARASWADQIGAADVIVLDCLRPCLDALGLSEDKEAGRFLVAFDALIAQVGASEAVVVHHMGHSSERSRGDSRLLDWPDVLWKIVRDSRDEDDPDAEESDGRYFSAMGRDVNVPESQLDWEPMTRSLTICGGDRVDRKARGALELIVDVMSEKDAVDGLTQNQLITKLKRYEVGRNVARKAIRKAVEGALLVVSAGPRHSQVHTLNPSHKKEYT